MRIIADLHIHSRFSRAVSPQMNVPTISRWANKKGIDLVATGDWTHPVWLRELQANLVETEEGLFKVKGEPDNAPRFLLSTELSSIYSQGKKGRRIHYLVFAPNLDVVVKVNKELARRGMNLLSDGRPILGLSAKAVTEIILGIDGKCLIIPAHAWTPWFSLYGSKSGFDSIEECYGEFSKYIYAVETGLSSDPAMNWRISELDDRQIVSFGDAHSPAKLGREATVFQVKNLKSKISYQDVINAIKGGRDGDWEIAHTIEFYPEEGKYHFTGHRNCQITYSANETRKKGTVCPVCGKPLTVGVMSRVESLASGEAEVETKTDMFGVSWIKNKKEKRPPYAMLIPLLEIIAEAKSVGVGSKSVIEAYDHLINAVGSEFKILLETPIEELEKKVEVKIVEGIKKVRSGDIVIEPGYDGVFGKVKIWRGREEIAEKLRADQSTLF